MTQSDTLVGKEVQLTPTQGAYQKVLAGKIVHETPTQFTVDAPGFMGRKFRKINGLPVSKSDRQFPCYKAEVKG